MNVLGFNTTGKPVDFFDQTYTWQDKNHLIRQSDFLVLLLPLVEETHHFIAEEEFQMMKKNAFVINVGRGPLVKESALVEALETEEIKGAALDVFDEEPLPPSNPLWDTKNLIITPHISGKTVHFFERSIAIFKDNHSSLIKEKQMPFLINFKKGY